MPEEIDRQEKNKKAILLLDEWLADESGYDEMVFPIVEKLNFVSSPNVVCARPLFALAAWLKRIWSALRGG